MHALYACSSCDALQRTDLVVQVMITQRGSHAPVLYLLQLSVMHQSIRTDLADLCVSVHGRLSACAHKNREHRVCSCACMCQ